MKGNFVCVYVMKEYTRHSTSSYFKYLWESQQLFDFIYLCFFLSLFYFFLCCSVDVYECSILGKKGDGDTMTTLLTTTTRQSAKSSSSKQTNKCRKIE